MKKVKCLSRSNLVSYQKKGGFKRQLKNGMESIIFDEENLYKVQIVLQENNKAEIKDIMNVMLIGKKDIKNSTRSPFRKIIERYHRELSSKVPKTSGTISGIIGKKEID